MGKHTAYLPGERVLVDGVALARVRSQSGRDVMVRMDENNHTHVIDTARITPRNDPEAAP